MWRYVLAALLATSPAFAQTSSLLGVAAAQTPLATPAPMPAPTPPPGAYQQLVGGMLLRVKSGPGHMKGWVRWEAELIETPTARIESLDHLSFHVLESSNRIGAVDARFNDGRRASGEVRTARPGALEIEASFVARRRLQTGWGATVINMMRGNGLHLLHRIRCQLPDPTVP